MKSYDPAKYPEKDDTDTIVLHRLRPRLAAPYADTHGTKRGVVLDVETTGIGPADEIIEVAALPFSYSPADGSILAVHEPHVQLRQPSIPIPDAVKRLTGIDDDMVAGKRLDLAALERVVAPAAICIAHGAQFDRRHLENISPVFVEKPWGCTIADIDWAAESVESAKLCFIAMAQYHFFYDKHRGLADCQAVIEILGREMPQSGGSVLRALLQSARGGRWRVRVFNTPYAARAELKTRGYRWDPGGEGRAKNWYQDFSDEAAADKERSSLTEGVFAIAASVATASVSIEWLSAFERFSSRA